MIINTQNISLETLTNQTDIYKLKDLVKQQLNNKVVAEIVIFTGTEVMKDYKFLNDKSFSISRTGYIKDWGATGFYGDIFDWLMQEKNINLPTAIKFVADCIGVEYE